MARRRRVVVGVLGGLDALTNLALLGGVAWVLFGRKAGAAAAALPVNAAGRVTESIPGVSVSASSGMPIAVPGESSASLADRFEAWGLATGQAYPTMEGYGSNREWYSWQANGPKGTLHGW